MKTIILVLLFIAIISLSVLCLSYGILTLLAFFFNSSINNLPSFVVDLVYFTSLVPSVYISLKIWVFIVEKLDLLEREEINSLLGPFAKK